MVKQMQASWRNWESFYVEALNKFESFLDNICLRQKTFIIFLHFESCKFWSGFNLNNDSAMAASWNQYELSGRREIGRELVMESSQK